MSDKTIRPSGVTLTRNGNNFIAKWKIADKDYGDGIQLQFKYTGQEWQQFTLGGTVTSKTLGIPLSKYYPEKNKYAKTLTIRVRGNRKKYTVKEKVKTKDKNGKTVTSEKNVTYNPTWSDWTYYTYQLLVPNRPKVTAKLDDEAENSTTFTWETQTSATDQRHYVNTYFQTMLVQNCPSDISKLNWSANQAGYVPGTWQSGNQQAGGTKTINDRTYTLVRGSYTRVFRIRAQGVCGVSSWRYGKHVYAKPNQPRVISATAKKNAVGGFGCTVVWDVSSTATRPIDRVEVQYTKAVPDAGMQCPSSATWTTANISKDTKGKDAAFFSVDGLLSVDECLFVRVNTLHDKDENTTYGEPTLVVGATGYLADPDRLSVSVDDVTYRATITAHNNSSVVDSFIAVIFKTANNPEMEYVVGVIPHGESSVTVQCPQWRAGDSPYFGVFAAAGTYEDSGVYELTTDTAVDTSKMYYERLGAGSEDDPYYYELVIPVGTENPSEEEWYEKEASSSYTMDYYMRSRNTVWEGGQVPLPPKNVSVSRTAQTGTVRVAWDWTWTEADYAELSWADHDDAWQSTNEPSTYKISNIHAAQWNISGLETGKEWWIRVRLIKGREAEATNGPWSELSQGYINLSSAPTTPSLYLSDRIITEEGQVTCSWAYGSTDGTSQAYAEISTVIIDNNGIHYGAYTLSEDTSVDDNKTYYELSGDEYQEVTPVGNENPYEEGWYEITSNVIAHVETAQHVTILARDVGWSAGETYQLAVRVTSGSGMQSNEWSDPVSVIVAEPLVAAIVSTSLETVTVIDDESVTRQVLSLTEMPLEVTATGAGEGGVTTFAIERLASYSMVRPDDNVFNGNEGETVALVSQAGEDPITIDLSDLIGAVDDGASYRLVVTVRDDLGQSAEDSIDFEVHWSHQAEVPTATAEVDDELYVAFITPSAPSSAMEGDVCDIYRLSPDKPELIVQGGEWGVKYVDPYPALGNTGGHRIVCRTANGDYITADNEPAWIDLMSGEDDIVIDDYTLIDFDGEQVRLNYNVDIDNSWAKDFEETKYLGGSVQGDWNAAVSRNSAVNTVTLPLIELDTIRAMRRLAVYTGICHVRTQDGSSYAADVQVSEKREHDDYGAVVSFALTVTRVDTEGFDGLSYDDWYVEGDEES